MFLFYEDISDDILFDEETIRKNHEASLIRETAERVEKETADKGIEGMVTLCRKLKYSMENTISYIMAQFDYDRATAEKRVGQFWN